MYRSLESTDRHYLLLLTNPFRLCSCRDMLQLMREFGSELSDTAVPPRKDTVQKASVVRQFRRWNHTFFEWFHYKNGKWIPKLGKKGELDRRARARTMMSRKKCAKTDGGSVSIASATPHRRSPI